VPRGRHFTATTCRCISLDANALKEITMQKKLALGLGRAALAVALIVPVAACDGMSRTQQRALSGGAIGAAGGAAVGAITGGSPVTGALIGGAGGAAVGALTSGGKR
jgi:osmotically inducible lipoprotein OsmB